MNETERQQMIEYHRRFDPGKMVNGSDGAFEPENRLPHGPLHPGKTQQDQMPADRRPRVEKAKKRAERMGG